MPAEEVLRSLIERRSEVASSGEWAALVNAHGMLVVLSREARLAALDRAIEILSRAIEASAGLEPAPEQPGS